LKDGIPKGLARELRNLNTLISGINREYSREPLDPEKVKDLTEIEILTILDKRKTEIDKILEKSEAKVLYELFHLTSEYVDPIVKKKLDNSVAYKVEELYASIESTYLQEKAAIIKLWRKKYLRSAIFSVREE